MIITLCGSAKFEPHFKMFNEILTMAGHTVFSLAVYPSDKNGVQYWYNKAQKRRLDEAHKQKISASQAILVLNECGYVGPSTLSEIEFAKQEGKQIYALENQWFEGDLVYDPNGAYKDIRAYIKDVILNYDGCSPIDFTKFKDWRKLLEEGTKLTKKEKEDLHKKAWDFQEALLAKYQSAYDEPDEVSTNF